MIVLGSAQRLGERGRGAAALDGRRRRLLRRPLPHARRRAPARASARDRRRRALLPLARRGAARSARRARRRAARAAAARRSPACPPPTAPRRGWRASPGTGTYELVTPRRRPQARGPRAAPQGRGGPPAGGRVRRGAAARRAGRARPRRPRRGRAACAARAASRRSTRSRPGFADAAAGRGIAAPVTALIELRPRGPYNLRMSLGPARDGTVRIRDGVAELAFATPAGPAYARVAQQTDGVLRIALDAPDDACALDRLRFLLAVDDDIAPFLAWPSATPLLRALVPRSRGLRAGRTGTCLHALVRALAGQLITTREAWIIERAIVRRAGGEHAGMLLSPRRDGPGTALGGAGRSLRTRAAQGLRARPGLARARPRAARRRAPGRRRGAAAARTPARALDGRHGLPARPRPLRPRPRRRPRADQALQLAARPPRRGRGHGRACSPATASGRASRACICCAPRCPRGRNARGEREPRLHEQRPRPARRRARRGAARAAPALRAGGVRARCARSRERQRGAVRARRARGPRLVRALQLPAALQRVPGRAPRAHPRPARCPPRARAARGHAGRGRVRPPARRRRRRRPRGAARRRDVAAGRADRRARGRLRVPRRGLRRDLRPARPRRRRAAATSTTPWPR